MSDFSSTVLGFATHTVTITRAAGPGDYNTDGEFVAEAESTSTARAVVVPLSGRELQRLPEGLRTRELRQVFTVEELRVSAPPQRPDVLTFDGYDWQVEMSDDWSASGNFYRSVVSKVHA